MGFLPSFLSVANVTVILIAAYVIYVAAGNFGRVRRIRALGGRAPVQRSYVLGLDLLYDAMRAYGANDALSFWLNAFKRNGHPSNPWTVEFGGTSERLVLTADPENIKAILATQFDDFGKGEVLYRVWFEFLGDGIFMTDGTKWHNSRKLIRPQFIKDRLSNLKVFEEHVQILIPMLGGHGKMVDVSNLFFRFALDTATHFLFGRSVDSLVHEQASFARAFDDIQHIESVMTRAGDFSRMIPKRKLRQQLKVLDQFISPYIEDALRLPQEELDKVSKSDDHYTLLHAIAAETRDPRAIRDQIVSVLLAGRDTTACTLSWLFYELSLQPKIVEKLRKEILHQVGPTKTPTYSDLKAMRYLQVRTLHPHSSRINRHSTPSTKSSACILSCLTMGESHSKTRPFPTAPAPMEINPSAS
jgi:cytochrome P450